MLIFYHVIFRGSRVSGGRWVPDSQVAGTLLMSLPGFACLTFGILCFYIQGVLKVYVILQVLVYPELQVVSR